MTTLISYIPALHRGYLDFFKKYSGSALYILGTEYIKETPRMDRDIRALAPEEVKTLVATLNIFSSVEVLSKESLSKAKGAEAIVMPDEDINHTFAETHLEGKTITFVPTFLRWDKQISTKEFEIPPDRVISSEEFDKEMIAAAIQEAEKSHDWWRQIGGVITKDRKIILSAHNIPLPSEYTLNALGDPRANFDAGEHIELSKFIHAEAGLIAEAAKKGIALEGTSLYVTTFPCPVCAKSVAISGIKRVYYSKGYSLLDGEDTLKAFGVEIVLVQ